MQLSTISAPEPQTGHCGSMQSALTRLMNLNATAKSPSWGDIYACTENVVNWLGPSTSHTALGLKILALLFGDKDISHGKHPGRTTNHPSFALACRISSTETISRESGSYKRMH
jgi:hypothetical protein